uniref:Uncharacterized protein n=1 Tax=Arundo donax TaxID=35708 RepID=A0A0A9HTR5_ARUDO
MLRKSSYGLTSFHFGFKENINTSIAPSIFPHSGVRISQYTIVPSMNSVLVLFLPSIRGRHKL